MSHFIIWLISALYLGTPKGQARTQLEQPMQRGFSELCTIPSGVFLIASAGQTCAQMGSSQCMQTWGAVWTLSARMMVSRWIKETPRCVSHSSQACMQALQPMQRQWSMQNSIGSAPFIALPRPALPVLQLRHAAPILCSPGRRRSCIQECWRSDRSRARSYCWPRGRAASDREQTLYPANGFYNIGSHRNGATPALNFHEVAFGDAKLPSEQRMYLT